MSQGQPPVQVNSNPPLRRSNARPPPTIHPTIPRSQSNQLSSQSPSSLLYASNRSPITTNQSSTINLPRPIPPPSHPSTSTLPPFRKLEAILDGIPHHLHQPGPQNRILLSLRSGILQEIDYALEILLVGSFYEPEVIQLGKFPGLIEALLGLIGSYQSPGPFDDPHTRLLRRHALEATLVIRNFITLDPFARFISANPRLPLTLLDGLETAQPDGDPEYLGLLLEILEGTATLTFSLDRPLQRAAPSPATDQIAGEEPAPSPPQWAADLFTTLDKLTGSSDRQLVLGAYRSLAALGLQPHNQAILGQFACHFNPAKLADPVWAPSLKRAITLLALSDVDLLLSALDYLYALTSTPALALALCIHDAHIQPLARLLLLHTRHQCHREPGPPQPLPAPTRQWFYDRPPPPKPKVAARGPPQTPTMTEVHKILLDDAALGTLATTPEPQRARDWMARVFESAEGAEVQQVTLWLAYKTQFESHLARRAGVPMIAPAEAIKLTTEVFGTACPSVLETSTGEKRFVIKGMRPREKIPLSDRLVCRWAECTETSIAGGPQAVYKHLLETHLPTEAEHWPCRWHTCSASPSTRNALRAHLATHFVITSPCAPRPDRAGFERLQVERRESPHGETAIGIGYLAFLVLRNLLGSVLDHVKQSEMEEELQLDRRALRIVEGGWMEREVMGWATDDVWLSNVAGEVLSCLEGLASTTSTQKLGEFCSLVSE